MPWPIGLWCWAWPGIGAALDAGEGRPLRTPVVALGEDPRRFLPELPGLVGAIPVLSEAAAGLGLVTLTPDVDGIVRRVPLVGLVGGQLLPSLALEAVRIAVGADKVFLRSGPNGITSISLGGTSLPVDGEGRAWVRYGLPDPDQYVRAADVLAGKVPAERLAGHIVFIGASAAGLGDIKPAPIVGAMPGVEIQASLLQTLVSGSILRRPAEVVQLENLSSVAARPGAGLGRPVLAREPAAGSPGPRRCRRPGHHLVCVPFPRAAGRRRLCRGRAGGPAVLAGDGALRP